MKLTAAKSMRYNGKSLEPGDPFEAVSERDFRILKAVKKAVDRDDVKSDLRERAEDLGIDVDKRWSEETLHEKIAEAQGGSDAQGREKLTYSRRDMRAKD